jgi:hypothetical protein
MNILLCLLCIIAIFIALFLVIALFIKKDYQVERETIIEKPKDEVFAYLKSLKNQNEWSVWSQMDPNMKNEYIGIDGTVGFISKWKGNNKVGEGEQEIKKITAGERIDNELRFMKPWKSSSEAYFITEAISESSTKVKWGLKGNMPYPMNAMSIIMNMDKMLGKDFQQGLENLKKKLES